MDTSLMPAWLDPVVAAVPLLPALYWRLAARRYQDLPLRESWDLIRFSPTLTQALLVIMALVSAIPLSRIGDRIAEGAWPRAYDSLFLTALLTIIAHKSVPPTILYLASSGPHSKKLILDMQWSVFPFRTVYLLRSSAQSMFEDLVDVDPMTEELVASSNLRANRENWIDIVRSIAGSVPLIVFDTRVNNPAMATELEHVLDTGLCRKTVFIIGDTSEQSLLKNAEAHGLVAQYPLKTTPVESILATLQSRLRPWPWSGRFTKFGTARTTLTGPHELPKRLAGVAWRLDELSDPKTAPRFMHFIRPLPPSDAIRLLLVGARQHIDPRVRRFSVVGLFQYELADEHVQSLLAALQEDPSEDVRLEVINFIGNRGAQNRQIRIAIPALLGVLTDRAQSNFLKSEAARALKLTVGAKVIVFGAPFELDQVQAELEMMAASPEDQVLQSDAKKYLAQLFGQTD